MESMGATLIAHIPTPFRTNAPRALCWRVMSFSARRAAEGWDTSPEEAALVEEVSAPARGIASLAWLRPFTSLLQLDLRHNRLCCLDGFDAC